MFSVPSSPRLLASVILGASALALAACSGSSNDAPPATAQTSASDTCGVSQLQNHIGELLEVHLLQFFEAAVPSHRVFVMKPGSEASPDVVPERATIKTDKDSMITSITCG